MKILLTGSAGFIGYHTAKALLQRGDDVVGLDNFNEYYDATLKESRNELLEQEENFTLSRGDIAEKGDLRKAFDLLGSGPDTRVCHLAAQAGVRHSIENPDIFLRDNILGFGNVIELTKERGVGGLIYASSSSVYGNTKELPLHEELNTDAQVSLYGMTKKSNELHAHVYHDLFGLEPGPIIVREDLMVRGCFIPVGDTNLELLEGTSPESAISAHISQQGDGLHHICFEVGGIADKLKTLEALGIPLLDKVPRLGLMGGQIGFLEPSAPGGVLIELAEHGN